MNKYLSFVIIALFLCSKCKCFDDNNTSSDVRTIKAGPKPPWNETYLDKLRNDLLTNYDKYARPGQHYDVTTVRIGLAIIYVETDELNSTVSVSLWQKLFWTDTKLKWNKTDYGGLESIKMADHEVWQPDIYLYNSASGVESVTRYGNPNALVFSDGTVLWVPPSKYTALCEFDLYYWPFDKQNCYLKFASWTHSGKEIKLELFDANSADLELDAAISPWEINVTAEVVTKHHDCCPDAFYNAQFNLTLVRKSSSYVAVLITPLISVVSLILIQCCLPSQGGRRIILSCFTAVMITMLLAHFTQKVSAMGRHTPWIVSFYSTSLYIVCISIAESIFVLLILQKENYGSLPWNIKKLLQGRLGKLLLLDQCTLKFNTNLQNQIAEELKDYHFPEFEDKAENDGIVKSTSVSSTQLEWEMFVIAVNRLLFAIYCLIYFVMVMCYLI